MKRALWLLPVAIALSLVGCPPLAIEWNLTITVDGQGTVDPEGGTFADGTLVTLSASPAMGWQLQGWEGVDEGSIANASATLTMDADSTVHVVFVEIPPRPPARPQPPPPTSSFNLRVEVVEGEGSVSPSQGVYRAGTVVDLQANPAAGYELVAWGGTDDDTRASLSNSVTILQDTVVEVHFQKIPSEPEPEPPAIYSLSASVAAGQGSLSPAAGDYEDGTVVTLTATPANGYHLDAWSGTDDDISTALTNKVTMNRDRTVAVTFVQITHQLTVNIVGDGTVNPGSSVYPWGKQLTLQATAAADWSFAGWSGDRSGTQNPLAITIDRDIQLTATFEEDIQLPPDPADVAPELDPTVPTDMADSVEFLYTGDDPIQTGVEPDTIKSYRVAVMRGRVLDPTGQPLGGVQVQVLAHDELGQTLTRADGWYDLAVNGGGHLTLKYDHAGYLPIQRQVDTPWRDFVPVPDVMLTALDTRVTSVALDAAVDIQVARGSVVSDDAGTRQATLLINPGTQAQITHSDGSTSPADTLNIRLTEYTVGENGPKQMPAALPPQVGYTYCVEMTADEALPGDAKEVRFDQPLYMYLENYLGFTVGTAVPVGYYDRAQGRWIGSANGRVIAVLGISGGLAELDTDGDGAVDDAATLAELSITEEELVELAALYTAGQSLWRVPITHFTPWDCNWPYGPGPGAEWPNVRRPRPQNAPSAEEDCKGGGSIVSRMSQVLGMEVPMAGTSYHLNYSSDRAKRPGDYLLDIGVTGPNVPSAATEVVAQIHVAGQSVSQRFAPVPGQSMRFVWDGHDAFGREVTSPARASIAVGYTYPAVYYERPADFYDAWNAVPLAGAVTNSQTDLEITFWSNWQNRMGPPMTGAIGLGPWRLDCHHAYDRNTQELQRGDGRVVRARSSTPLLRMVVDRVSYDLGCNSLGSAFTVAENGTLYYLTYVGGGQYILNAYNPQANTSTVIIGPHSCTAAGDGDGDGDGGPAIAAQVRSVASMCAASDGSLYLAESGLHRVRRIGPGGIITTVAGGNGAGYSGDGGPANMAQLNQPWDLAVSEAGELYIADKENRAIRVVGTDGVIRTFASTTDTTFFFSGHVISVAVAPDGSIYYVKDTEDFGFRTHQQGVFRIDRLGQQVPVVGGPHSWDCRHFDVPALGPKAWALQIEFSPSGTLYFLDDACDVLRRLEKDDEVTSILGKMGPFRLAQPDGSYIATELQWIPRAFEIAPNGTVYVENGRIFELTDSPSGAADRQTVNSQDGTERYVFDAGGRHLRTLEVPTGITRHEFGYNDGLLTSLTDANGAVTTIERDAAGTPLAIVAPNGQRTELTLDENGFLSEVLPAGGPLHRFTHTEDGLLRSYTDSRNDTSTYTYDEFGLLVRDEDAEGGFQELDSTVLPDGREVTHRTALGRETTYSVEQISETQTKLTVGLPSGHTSSTLKHSDSSYATTTPDGSVINILTRPDPRFSVAVPILDEVTLTTPAGLTQTIDYSYSVVLDDNIDPFSLTESEVFANINDLRTYRVRYEADTRTISTRSPEDRQTTTALDEDGRIVSTSAATFEPTTFSYDEDGRLKRVAQGNMFWENAFDTLGRISSRRNALDQEIRYGYDAGNRPISFRLPSGRTYTAGYDDGALLANITMPSEAVYRFELTADGEMKRFTPPGSSDYVWSYDLDGQPDGVTLPSGTTITTTYDSAGRPASMVFPEATLAFGFGAGGSGCCGGGESVVSLGRTPTTIGSSQAINFTYDGPLTTEMRYNGAAEGTYTYTYDNNFFLQQATLASGPDSVSLTIDRDRDGLATRLGPFTMTRSVESAVTESIADGTLNLAIGYDPLGRMNTRTHTISSTPVYGYTLEFDAAGRISSRTENVGGTTRNFAYTYDADGRLLTVTRDDVTVESYTYDQNGNRATDAVGAYVYDVQDRLQTGPLGSYGFNIDAQLQSRDSDVYTHDARGNLIAATVGGIPTQYSYDGYGRRVARHSASGTGQFFYGDPQNSFVVSASRSPDGTLQTYFHDETGLLYALQRGSTTWYVATDHVGTPRVVTDASGVVVLTRAYDSFGRLLSESDPGFYLPIGFAGGLHDPDTGMVRFGLRDYDTQTGRWTTRDPTLHGGSPLNLYTYANSDPVNCIDRAGLAVTFGGSLYGLLGGGGKISIGGRDVNGKTKWGITVCGEVGFGAGGGLDIGLMGDRPGDGRTLLAEAAAGPLAVGGQLDSEGNFQAKIGFAEGLGPLGFGVEWVWDPECGWRPVPKLQWDVGTATFADGTAAAFNPGVTRYKTEGFGTKRLSLSVKAKIAGEVCGALEW